MRTLHLIESARTAHATGGMHSFLSISAHVTVVLAALYATARPPAEREAVPDARVYFVPEQRPTPVAPSAPAAAAVAPKPATPAPAPATVAPVTAAAPISVPPVELRLGDPSAAVAQAPASSVVEGSAMAGGGETGRGEPYDASEVELPAAPLSKGGPKYPERAIQLGLSGAVTARFIVGADGRVESDITVLSTTGPEFTAAVRDFLRRARYRAARVGGQPVRQLVEQRFVSALRGS